MTVKTKTKARSRILDTVHATAGDLHAAGLIDAGRMREFDMLCRAQVAADGGEALSDSTPPESRKRNSV